MSETGLVQILEGALLAAGKPMTVTQLADLFEEHERPENTAIREALETVAERCEDRGFELLQVASGFRFQVRQNLSPWIGRLWQERPQRYSRALLETLALIAYRQPITRGEIEEIRGVAVSSNIVKTLHEREWIRVVGHRDVPGRPAMYATTKQFLDYFNLKSLDQLPALAEIRDLETLNAELGFSEPLPESLREGATEEGTPELTVVGGTEHVPEGSDEPGEVVDAQAAAEGEVEDDENTLQAVSDDDTSSEDSIELGALAENDDHSHVDSEDSEQDASLSLADIADALESRAVEPVEGIEDEHDNDEFPSAQVVKPDSQA